MNWSNNTKREIDNAVYRAKQHGLNDGQTAIWHAMDRLSLEQPEPPSLTEIAKEACVSRSLVWWTIPVLESLGYIRVNRNRQGHICRRGIVLLIGPEDEVV